VTVPPRTEDSRIRPPNDRLLRQTVRFQPALEGNFVAFLLAGHEPPAGALTRVWYVLEDHPDLYEALREEYDRVVDSDRPTIEHYDALESTQRVVAETLRLYPPTTSINRQATEPVQLGGYELPEWARFLIPRWVPHRDEQFWDDPEAFDPGR
jgi:cytochrome P450